MKVTIIGGGAAGVIHALYLRKLNKNIEICILEKNDRILKKILKTGNGRCNISNLEMEPGFYNNPSFISRLYERITPQAVREFFLSLGLLLRTDNSSRLYPYSFSAKTLIETLLFEIQRNKIEVQLNTEVLDLKKEAGFVLETNKGVLKSDYLVIASGSRAQEETSVYEILSNKNHHLTKLRPGLVALKVEEDLKSLQGIRVKCLATVIEQGKKIYSEAGEILFKNKGLSGVLTLNLSRYARVGSIISLDLFNDYPGIIDYIKSFRDKKDILEILASILPRMLALYIVKRFGNDFDKILKNIHNLEFRVVGDYGYNQGQIVIGGIDLKDINADFSSKIIDDLYIIGEILDIDGACGGYNLHFAWSSGIMSAISIFEKNL